MDSKILELTHATAALPGGGFVLVLNTGAVITPEAEAMLQALHSRSVGGIRSHLKTLAAKGAQNFMGNFYVGYGHKSIGDCGTGTIFFEGVSMLAAKAIQDWLLYSGQEASTRYIDFAMQKFIDPVGSIESARILEAWRSFYLASLEPLCAYLRIMFPRREGEDEKVYNKAIVARCFDILRGFLPAGAMTNLAWHSNLRQVADHLALLRHHPLVEVRDIATAMENVCKEAFPSSFGHKQYQATEDYNGFWMESGYYYFGSPLRHSPSLIARHRELQVVRDSFDLGLLATDYAEFIETRPLKTELPKQMAECGTMRLEFLIDFGSLRDIQRQRSVIQRMPMLTTDFGMHPWYFESLPEELAQSAKELVRAQCAAIQQLHAGRSILQYYLPMGMCVPCRLTGDLPALTYVVERRAQTDVHPTLHEVALWMADALEERLGFLGLKLYTERDTGRFDIKRGLQDIVQKS